MEPVAKMRLVAVGDIALNGGYEELARQGRAQEVLSGVAPLLRKGDLVLGNLEGPLDKTAFCCLRRLIRSGIGGRFSASG